MVTNPELDALSDAEETIGDALFFGAAAEVFFTGASLVTAVLSSSFITLLIWVAVVKFFLVPAFDDLIKEGMSQMKNLRERRKSLVQSTLHHPEQGA